MAEKKFSELPSAASLTGNELAALSQMQSGSLASVKSTLQAIANWFAVYAQYTTALQTTDKSIAGAINELKQLISLIPQFSIEVVEELPTEDISDTTIYLVPAEDPEVGNYYEEYIHVNSIWELLGTTAVDLSGYYTKLEVDGLLATKASVAEVALKENKSDMPTDVRSIIKDCKTPKSATITNGIAQFDCIEENLVKGLKLTMNPIQDLHGYSNPWVGGAGKNKLNIDIDSYSTSGITISVNNGVVTTSGTATANTTISLLTSRINVSDIGDTYKLVDDGSFTFSTNLYLNIRYYDSNGSAISNQALNSGKSMNLVIPSNATTFMPMIIIKSGITANGTIKPMLMLQSVTDNSFAPYSNICPISGRTEASVTRTGKNLFDFNSFKNTAPFIQRCSLAINSDGSVTATSTSTGSCWVGWNGDSGTLGSSVWVIKAKDKMCFSSGLSNLTWGVYELDENRNMLYSSRAFTDRVYTKHEQNSVYYAIRINIFEATSTGQTKTFYPQIEYGESVTEFEPYTAETNTHQYSETIYGGVDDFVNGELSVEWGYIASYDEETLPGEWISDRDVYAPGTTPTTGAEVCYKLATPTTIETSAEEITTVSGTNIISGTEPISECQYTELATVDDLIKIIGGQ